MRRQVRRSASSTCDLLLPTVCLCDSLVKHVQFQCSPVPPLAAHSYEAILDPSAPEPEKQNHGETPSGLEVVLASAST